MQNTQKDSHSQPISPDREHHSTNDTSLEADNDEYEPAEIQLPSHGLLYALIIGIAAGLIATALHIGITLINAPLYNEASRLADKMSSSTAQTIVGLGCLNVFIDLASSFIVGYAAGRIAVLRRYGALAGALFGATTYLVGFIVQYLPNYPGKTVSNTSSSSQLVLAGILTSVVIVAAYSAIAALMGLWGAWAATRKHPYYQSQEQE